MSAWNTYFISKNCGANIDFLFLKQWFYGILFWNMKEAALWVTNLTLMVNGTMDWVSLCEGIERAEKIVSSWWGCSLLMDITTNQTWSGQQERWNESESRSPGCTPCELRAAGWCYISPTSTYTWNITYTGLPRFWWFIATLILRCHGKGSDICTCCYRNYEICRENKQGIR